MPLNVKEACQALRSNSTSDIRLYNYSESLQKSDARALSDAFKANYSVRCLTLTGSVIDDESFRIIIEPLKHSITLRRLTFYSIPFGPQGAKVLADMLRINTSLIELELDHTSLINLELDFKGIRGVRTEGAKPLADSLKINSTLRILTIIHSTIGEQGALAFASALKVNSTLHELNFKWCRIEDNGACALAKALEDNSSLRKLNLLDNGIGTKGLCALANMLKINPSLKVLDLGWNQFESKGIQELADALKTNSSLQDLWLIDCNVGDDGARMLAEALKVNSSLRFLNLHSNGIGDEGALALAEALTVNRSLQKLNLCGISFKGTGRTRNPIGLGGIRALAKALLENDTMIDLSLDTIHSEIQSLERRNMKRLKRNRKRRQAILNYRRSFQAWRDRSRIFISAREGRPMELRVRLRWGKFAGGLALRGDCDGELMTPLEAARKRGHQECIEALVHAAFSVKRVPSGIREVKTNCSDLMPASCCIA